MFARPRFRAQRGRHGTPQPADDGRDTPRNARYSRQPCLAGAGPRRRVARSHAPEVCPHGVLLLHTCLHDVLGRCLSPCPTLWRAMRIRLGSSPIYGNALTE